MSNVPHILHVVADKKYQEKELFKICKKSWEEYNTDYEIRIYDEDSDLYKKYLDICPDNIKTGRIHKGYICVWIGLNILYEFGGILVEADHLFINSDMYNYDGYSYGFAETEYRYGSPNILSSNYPIKLEKNNEFLKKSIELFKQNFKNSEFDCVLEEVPNSNLYNKIRIIHLHSLSTLRLLDDKINFWGADRNEFLFKNIIFINIKKYIQKMDQYYKKGNMIFSYFINKDFRVYMNDYNNTIDFYIELDFETAKLVKRIIEKDTNIPKEKIIFIE